MCPVFEMILNEKSTLWLLDTGASKSLVTPQFMKQNPHLKIYKTNFICKGANDEEIPLEGAVNLDLQLAEETYNFSFQVSKCQLQNLSGIIGMDILSELEFWNVGGNKRKGAYLNMNGQHLALKAFIHKNITNHENNKVTQINSNTSEMNKYSKYQTTNDSKTNVYNIWQIRSLLTDEMMNISVDCEDRGINIINECIMDASAMNNISVPIKQEENIKVEEPNETEKDNDLLNIGDNGGSCHYKTRKTDSVQRYELHTVMEGQERDKYPHQNDDIEWSHKPNNAIKAQGPRYSLLFQNCQNKGYYSNIDVEDEVSTLLIYAMEGKINKANNYVTLNIRSNYSLKTGPVVFTPSYDKNDKQLIHLEANDSCNKRATIRIFNNTPLGQRIVQHELIGRIEPLSTSGVFTPSFVCTGDRGKYGSEKEWYKDNSISHIFSTLISINQQENCYETSNGVYLPGPKPEVQIETVIADITDKTLFGNKDIICQQINCTMRTAHGWSKHIAMSYPYGSVYKQEMEGKRNVLPDNLLREPGTCIMKNAEDNSPSIANITGQTYCGKAIDNGGYQNIYLNKHGPLCGKKLTEYLKEDTTMKRLEWFEKGLQDLYSKINTTNTQLRIYFPKLIGCDSAGGSMNKYMNLIKEFANKVSEKHIQVFMVIDPKSCKSSDFDKFESLRNLTKRERRKHKPGLYKDAPKSLCKDITCAGCTNNKMVLKLLAEEMATENNQPVKDIDNGMLPEIPRVGSENERLKEFTKMLETIKPEDISEKEVEEVKGMLLKYAKLFLISEDDEPGLITDFEAKLETVGEPISCKPRKFGPRAIKIMEKLNETMSRKGLAVPCDGPWSSPVVLVKKKPLPGLVQDLESPSSYRFCIDYRSINKNSIVWKAYPTGDLRAMLHKAAGYVYNTTIDVTNAFYCVAIREIDVEKTAFQLPSGLWAFTRLPQGLKISPQIWAKAADRILKPVQDIASWYVDDIFVGSNTFGKHLKDVEKVLHQLLKSGLKIRFEKCLFFRIKVKWLGHILSQKGIQPDPEGIQAIRNLKPPKDVKQMRSVLGTMVYFKDFIHKFSDLTAPLYKLLQKGCLFKWEEEQESAFEMLKNTLTSDTVLRKPDFNQDFYLQTDASDIAVSAILSQKDDNEILRPIQFWSKKLSGAEINYGCTEKEGLAIYLAFRKFETYLLLNTTHIFTDAAVLKAYYGNKDITNKRILRWALFVGQFEHTVTHIKGPDNVLADMLSRCVKYPSDMIISIFDHQENDYPGNLSIENIRYNQRKDTLCKALFKYYEQNIQTDIIQNWTKEALEYYDMSRVENIIIYKDTDSVFGNQCRIVIPKLLIPMALYYNHDTLLAGHQGVERTFEKLRKRYFWPTLRKDLREYVLSCDRCQRYKTNISPYFSNYVGNMKLVADEPNEILFVDLAYSQTSQEGYSYMLIIVDAFSRLVEALPMKNMTAQEITNKITTFCCIHGFPSQIFSDAAGDFKKAMMDDCSHLINIRHKTSIPWRHQPNISERYIQLIKSGLRLMIPENRMGWWPRYIKFIVYTLNTSYSKSLGMSPFEAYFSRQPNVTPTLGNLQLHTNYEPNRKGWIEELRKKIKETSETMKNKYIEIANKNVKKLCPNVAVGDLVMIRRHTFTPGISVKLQAQREGPMRIQGVCGSRISLEFVDDQTKKRERHISDLAKYYERPGHLQKPTETNEKEIEVELELEPNIISGNICTVDCGKTALLVIKWDCITYKPNLSITTGMKAKYSYFSQVGNSKPLSSNTNFVKKSRDPGSIQYYISKTRHGSGPVIATTVVSIMEGPPYELRDIEDNLTPDCYVNIMNEDTIENRKKWTKGSIKNLQDWIINESESTITAVYIEVCLVEGNIEEPSNDLWKSIKQFTWKMNTYGIKVFVVKPKIEQ